MINTSQELFRWGPIPGRLISVCHWRSVFLLFPKKFQRYVWPESYVLFKSQKMLYINSLFDLEKVGGEAFNKLILTKRRKHIWQLWLKNKENLFSFCSNLDRRYLNQLSENQLKQDWSKLNDLIDQFWIPGIIPELSAYGGQKILRKTLEKEHLRESKFLKVLAVLTAPTRPSFYQEEERNLLRVLQAQPSSEKLTKQIKQHQQKYFWLENSYFRTKVLTVDYFKKKVKELIHATLSPRQALKEMDHQSQRAKAVKSKILITLKQKNKLKQISNGLTHCIWWQDQRKGFIFQYQHFLNLFLKEFARRGKISLRLFDYAWPEEVTVRLSAKVKNTLLLRQQKPFVAHFSPNKVVCYYGEKARSLVKELWEEKTTLSGKLKGIVASYIKKKVQGPAFVIRRAGDIQKFPKDHILVATMTAPDYIVAIKKAKAIVTDTGGITSHAAIVSRELGIPCIVGTKIATKVLNDGDLVEVDAKAGVVKKIKSLRRPESAKGGLLKE